MNLVLVVINLILVDLVLGADNAVVIALATKNLDGSIKKKAAFLGAILAIILRVIFVVLILLLGELHLPFLNLISGGLLIYVALSLLNKEEEEHNIQSSNTMFKAVRTIVVADAVMSLDNAMVIAVVAAKANLPLPGEIILIICALLFSFPIILYGANILSKIMDKFFWIIYILGFILVHVALELILKDKILLNVHNFLESHHIIGIFLLVLSLVIVILKVLWENKENKEKN